MKYFNISWRKCYEPYLGGVKTLFTRLMVAYKAQSKETNLPKFISIGRTSTVVGRLEFWITLKEISSLMYK